MNACQRLDHVEKGVSCASHNAGYIHALASSQHTRKNIARELTTDIDINLQMQLQGYDKNVGT